MDRNRDTFSSQNFGYHHNALIDEPHDGDRPGEDEKAPSINLEIARSQIELNAGCFLRR